MKKLVKIYCLYEPHTLKIRYIGRTTISLKDRLYRHIYSSKNHKKLELNSSYKICWILSLLKQGIKPKIRLLTVIEGWEESHKFEKDLIQKHLTKHKLVNGDDRGPGNLAKNTKIEVEKQRVKKIKEHFNKEENKTNFYNSMYVYNLDGTLFKQFKSVKFAALETGVPSKIITVLMNRFDNHQMKVTPRNNYFFSKNLYDIHPLALLTDKYQNNHITLKTKDLITEEIKHFSTLLEFGEYYNLKEWDLSQYRRNILTTRFKNLLQKIQILMPS